MTLRASRKMSPRWRSTLGGRHRVKPVDRLMSAREAANVRTGPSPDYDIVGTVMAGDELQVTGEVRGRDWLRVAYPRSGDEAYIYGPLLKLVAQQPRPTPSTTTPSTPDTTAAPQTSGPSWSIAENQPCEVWNYGNMDYEPLTWSGPCMNGKAAGSGRLVFRNGEGVYDGAMQGGKLHGRGVLDWTNGFRYEGELRDGKQHGQGTLTQANGARYVGGWREGRPHGQGTYRQADGTTFEGRLGATVASASARAAGPRSARQRRPAASSSASAGRAEGTDNRPDSQSSVISAAEHAGGLDSGQLLLGEPRLHQRVPQRVPRITGPFWIVPPAEHPVVVIEVSRRKQRTRARRHSFHALVVERHRIKRRGRTDLLLEALGEPFADEAVAKGMGPGSAAHAQHMVHLVRKNPEHPGGPFTIAHPG